MLPAVSSGPLDPAWSPDGSWIAFSMRGDIWKVPGRRWRSRRGHVRPAYHFEPAWSPDGSKHRLLLSISTGNLESAWSVRTAATSSASPIDRRVDVQPAWSKDGAAALLRRARAAAASDIYPLPTSPTSPDAVRSRVRAGFQPRRLTRWHHSSPTSAHGRAASARAGLWIKRAGQRRGDARARRGDRVSRASRHGRRTARTLLFSLRRAAARTTSRIVPAGRRQSRSSLTPMPRNEYVADASVRTARRFAFVVSSRPVPTTLYVAPIGGGRAASWRKCAIKVAQAGRADRPGARSASLGPRRQADAGARLPRCASRQAALRARRRLPPRRWR